jgi:type VI secretion system secreted protein Hcp
MGMSNVFLALSKKGFGSDGDAGGTFGSTVNNKKGLIEVLDYDFKIWQEGSEEGGRPRSVESVKRSTFNFKKYVDNRSPLLFEYCVKGEYISEAQLRVYGTDSAEPYLKYTMSYVHVSKYEPHGGDDLPTEKIELKYGQMKVEWKDQHSANESANIARAWSWVMEMPGEETIMKKAGEVF